MSLVVPFEEIFAEESGLTARHDSWLRIELGRVCGVLNGYPFESKQFNGEKGFPIVRIRDLSVGRTKTFYDGEVPPEAVVGDGDLLIGMDGIFRCWEWTGGPVGLNQRVCKLIPDETLLNRKFLLFSINGYLEAIEKATSSVTVGHLSSRDILRIPIPLPCIAEQRRIVAQVEAILTKVRTAQERLDKIPTILKRFRQSVLEAACAGKLTADWRDIHCALPMGSPSSGDDENDQPATWRSTRFGDVTDSSFYGPRFASEDYSTEGVPTIRTTDMSVDGSLDIRASPRLKLSAHDLQRYALKHSDLLVTRTGATIGKCALYEDSLGPAIPSAYLIRFRLKTHTVQPKFALLYLMSPQGQQLLTGGTTAVAQPNVNATTISEFTIPLPPIKEQEEIVRRASELLSLANRLHFRYQSAKTQVDKITQSILAKAFRGELVPTEAELARREGRSYEKAEELLNRVRAQAQGPSSKSPRRRPVR